MQINSISNNYSFGAKLAGGISKQLVKNCRLSQADADNVVSYFENLGSDATKILNITYDHGKDYAQREGNNIIIRLKTGFPFEKEEFTIISDLFQTQDSVSASDIKKAAKTLVYQAEKTYVKAKCFSYAAKRLLDEGTPSTLSLLKNALFRADTEDLILFYPKLKCYINGIIKRIIS